jgi:hypothetical protein
MKKIYVVLTGLIVLCITLSMFDYAYTYPNGAPVARTGLIGETSCNGGGCHNNTIQSGSTGTVTNTLTFNGVTASSYVPGTTYNVVLGISGGTNRHGFELMVLNSNNSNVGSLIAGTGNSAVAGAGRTYLTQTAIFATSTSFRWTAPAAGSGTATFYVITYSGNGRSSTASILRTSTITLTEASPTPTAPDISATCSSALNAYPNPAIESLTLNVKGLSPQSLSLQIVNISGTIVKEMPVRILDHENSFTINVEGIASGSYFILGQAKEGVLKTRFVKQ